MRVVHHSNYVRYLELARIRWLDEHHRPYREYVAEGLHFATTHVDVRYHQSAVYDDVVEITTWLDRVTGASIRMAYELRVTDTTVVTGVTEHVLVNDEGRIRRIPAEHRERFKALSAARET
jgi:acyl-CoA thioester hydrolase